MRDARGHFTHGGESRDARQPFLRQMRVLRAQRLFGHVDTGAQPSGRPTIGVPPRDATPVDAQPIAARATQIEFAFARSLCHPTRLQQEAPTLALGVRHS